MISPPSLVLPAKRPSYALAPAYRRRQSWLATVLVLQLVGGVGVLFAPGQEVFPLYSWFLFPLTPTSPRTMPAVHLLEYRGQRHEPPLPLETDREVVSAAQAPTVVRLAQDLARAVAAGDEAVVRLARRKLEDGFLRGEGRYALVELSYDPIARLHGTPEQTRTVREFKIGEP